MVMYWNHKTIEKYFWDHTLICMRILSHLTEMMLRKISAISLGPTSNFQGTHKWLNTNTGRWIIQKQRSPLPMMNMIIKVWNIWLYMTGRRTTPTSTIESRHF